MYEKAIEIDKYKMAAFNLNQAAEHAYKSALLVCTGLCPNEHYLGDLAKMTAEKCDPAFGDIFPMDTQWQEDTFKLLDYAYIGARYDPKYKITKEQLEYLAPHDRKLLSLNDKICTQKLESFIE